MVKQGVSVHDETGVFHEPASCENKLTQKQLSMHSNATHITMNRDVANTEMYWNTD